MTTLGILLESGTHARAHYALVVAAGAAAIGRDVVVFATNRGCLLLAEPCPLMDDPREAAIAARGVAGIATLRAACIEMGVRLIACDAGLRAEELVDMPLAAGVEVAGIVTFLQALGAGQVVTL
ncbi:DsrE family protein [Roseomonas sp. CECT 9278]|uniref:DsrE family protein n=1 Tax=Roseomonas sp. CECT 9278 TaxID=2845823 RepID=UPI001E5192A4|nr:DsrE family protein [Roseomonas sp. CECT 9278]